MGSLLFRVSICGSERLGLEKMGAFSIWHWLIVLVVVLVLFGGKGKISSLMGDFGKGLKSFKRGMKEDDADNSLSEEIKETSEQRKSIKSDEGATVETADLKSDKARSGQ